jgi:hypothetical protein
MRRELGKLRTSIRQAMSWLRSRPTNAARLCVEWPTVKMKAARRRADEPVREGTAADEAVRGIGSPS